MEIESAPSFAKFMVLMEQRRYAQAEAVARGMIGADPGDDFAYGLLCDALRAQSRSGESVAPAVEALRLDPNHALLVVTLLVGLGAMLFATVPGIAVLAVAIVMLGGVSTAKTALLIAIGFALALFLGQYALNSYVEWLSPRLARRDYLNGYRDSD